MDLQQLIQLWDDNQTLELDDHFLEVDQEKGVGLRKGSGSHSKRCGQLEGRRGEQLELFASLMNPMPSSIF